MEHDLGSDIARKDDNYEIGIRALLIESPDGNSGQEISGEGEQLCANAPGGVLLFLGPRIQKKERSGRPTFLDDALNFYVGRVRTDDVPLLTDNYAPIDTMVF